MLWTHELQQAAFDQGWGLFWADDKNVEIQKLDDSITDGADTFDNDDEAIVFVVRNALEGDKTCLAALEFLYRRLKNE